MDRKLLAVLFFIALAAMPTAVFAGQYFEYNPDYFSTGSIYVSAGAAPSEVFTPQNDYFNGFDFWLDNNGSSGPAQFELLVDGTVMATKNMTIPHISPVAGGQRFHISFNQIPIDQTKLYSVRLNSSLPQLRLYYGNRVKFLPHNAPYLSEYANGVAMLGDEKKDYSFKFALYEDNETKIPVLANIAVKVISETQVRISFNADEPVDYKISYGLKGQGQNIQTQYLSDYKFCSSGIGICELLLDVQPDSNYDFMLSVKDEWENTAQAAGSFDSAGSVDVTPIISPSSLVEDTTPPIISNIRLLNNGQQSVIFTWTTDEAADSFYLVSIMPYMITIDAGSDPVFELEHYLSTEQVLSPNTEYVGTLTSHDHSNNATSVRFVFTTSGIQGSPTPTISPTNTVTPTPSDSSSPTPTPSSSQIPTPEPTISFLPSLTPIPSNEPTPSGSSTPTTTPSGTETQNPTPSSPNNNLPPLIIDSGSDGSTIGWSAPSGGEPGGGYRIDIFNDRGERVATTNVPAGTHEAKLGYTIGSNDTTIVYADRGGVFQKIAQPAKGIPSKSFLEKLVIALPWILGIIFFLAIGVALFLKYIKKQKAAPPPSADSGVETYSSAESVGH